MFAKLELKIPPVIVFIVLIGPILYFSSDATAFAQVFTLWHLAAVVCFLCSGVIGIAGVVEFRRHKTTVDPRFPHKASNIVVSGVFQYTRNPMYVALLLLMLAITLLVQSYVGLLCSLLFVLYMTEFQIKPEERILLSIFGEEYASYMQQVGRWC